jgi:L-alanine-DL-glutamate epimerase-like enolase superfamily enzyme
MIKKASELNLKVMMGSMNECTVGSAAIAHFLPQLDYVDMDGPLLLKEDIATGLQYDNGVVTISDNPGLGINVQW